MYLNLLKSKIHRATVTASNLNYEGSISIDKKLIKAANLYKFEKVEIYNICNGNRFETYIIEGKAGEISLNGAAARLVQVGDLIIIASYSFVEVEKTKTHKPTLVFVNKNNIIKKIK